LQWPRFLHRLNHNVLFGRLGLRPLGQDLANNDRIAVAERLAIRESSHNPGARRTDSAKLPSVGFSPAAAVAGVMIAVMRGAIDEILRVIHSEKSICIGV